jgi:hypothetical protein
MMREVPRSEWDNFFSSFSLQYQGWLIGLEAHGPNGRTQFALRELPLCAVTADLKNTGQDSITITIGTDPAEHLTYRLDNPIRVRVTETGDRALEALDLESASGATVHLQFRVAVLPETVDGVLLEG